MSAVYDPAHSAAGALAFYYYGGATNSRTEAMRIVGGNVGIGTTSPGATLDVNGHIADSSSSTPSASSCGGSPGITGNDTRGIVTFGSSGTP